MNVSKDNNEFGCFAFFFAIVLILIVAIVGTAIYLALKNWG